MDEIQPHYERFAARRRTLFEANRSKSPNPFSMESLGARIGRDRSWVSRYLKGKYQTLDVTIYELLDKALA